MYIPIQKAAKKITLRLEMNFFSNTLKHRKVYFMVRVGECKI